MTNSKRHLIARLARFVNASELIDERAAEAYDYDSLFDGGEFSGPAIQRQVTRQRDAAARRLGFACADLAEGIADQFGVRVRRDNGFEIR